MKKAFVLVVVTVCASVVAASANATLLAYSFTNPSATTEISQSGNLGLFDTNLGTLNSISFTLNGKTTTTIGLTNDGVGAQQLSATSTVKLLAASSSAGINAYLAAHNPVVNLSNSTGFVLIAAGATASFGPIVDTDSTILNPLAVDFALFSQAGGGTFDVLGTSMSDLVLSGGGGNITTSQMTTATFGASIVYDYTDKVISTPEPASLGLLGLGLVGIATIARRKIK